MSPFVSQVDVQTLESSRSFHRSAVRDVLPNRLSIWVHRRPVESRARRHGGLVHSQNARRPRTSHVGLVGAKESDRRGRAATAVTHRGMFAGMSLSETQDELCSGFRPDVTA